MKNSFLKNFTIIVSASGISQIIAFISAPIVARFYGPEIIGLFATILSICLFVVPLTNLSIPIAIPVIKNKKDYRIISKLAPKIISLSLSSIFFLLIFLYFFNQSIFLETGGPFFIFIFIIFLFLFSNREIIEGKLIYNQQFSKKAQLLFLYTFIFAFLRIFFGLIYPSIESLYLSQIIALFVFIKFQFDIKKLNLNDLLKFNNSEKDLLSRYKSFLNYRSFQIIINKLSQSFPLIFLTSFFSATYAGYFAMSKAILLIPSGIVGRAFSELMIHRLKKYHMDNKERLFLVLLCSQLFLFFLSIPFALLIFFYIEDLVLLILGNDWTTITIFIKVMLPWIVLSFTASLSVVLINILHSNKHFFYFEITHTIFRFISLYLCFILKVDYITVIASYSVVSALFNLIFIIWILQKTYRISYVS